MHRSDQKKISNNASSLFAVSSMNFPKKEGATVVLNADEIAPNFLKYIFRNWKNTIRKWRIGCTFYENFVFR